jgi:maleate isomerase
MAVGHRAKVGVIIPSTNTVVEHDLHQVRPRGVTFHAGRMFISQPALDSDEAFEALLGQIRSAISTAVRDVLTCEPDHLLMGMSAETFWDGVDGNRRFTERIEQQSGLRVTTGASSCREALEALRVQRIAVLTPYQPVADEQVRRFFTESGFDVVAARGLRCPTATAIAQVTPRDLVGVLADLDGPQVDAIVQCGTNLSMLRLADEAERWLGKPVIAINAATLWHALRTMGINDRFDGFGTLLREL